MSEIEIDHRDWVLKCFCYEKVAFDKSDSRLCEEASNIIECVCVDLQITRPNVLWLRAADPTVVAAAFNSYSTPSPAIHPTYARIPCSDLRCSDEPDGYTPRAVANEIWLLMNLPFQKLAFVAAHEMRHLWQKTQVGKFSDRCDAECDAYAYTYIILKKYLASANRLTAEVESELDQNRERRRQDYVGCCPGFRCPHLRQTSATSDGLCLQALPQ